MGFKIGEFDIDYYGEPLKDIMHLAEVVTRLQEKVEKLEAEVKKARDLAAEAKHVGLIAQPGFSHRELDVAIQQGIKKYNQQQAETMAGWIDASDVKRLVEKFTKDRIRSHYNGRKYPDDI